MAFKTCGSMVIKWHGQSILISPYLASQHSSADYQFLVLLLDKQEYKFVNDMMTLFLRNLFEFTKIANNYLVKQIFVLCSLVAILLLYNHCKFLTIIISFPVYPLAVTTSKLVQIAWCQTAKC